jgi:hypothetical protein
MLAAILGGVRLDYEIARTVNGVEVRLFHSMLERIFHKHGELRDMRSLILDTVSTPDLILVGYGKELLALKHYNETPLGAKDMVVVYREDKQLIITAFLTSGASKMLRKRRRIWQRPS